MAFLLAGVALGATAVALSERDRQYYQTSKYSMDYLGNKNGLDIYKDRVSGFYYTDDGWDVRRVGKTGWRPHPIDLERLKSKLSKYSPNQVRFSGYILATYIDKEQQLWDTIFKRFEMPKQPSKPHFARGLRKARWEKYDEEVEQYEAAAERAKAVFRDECEAWNLKKQEYNGSHEQATAGGDLLQAAFNPTPKPAVETFKITVPADKRPGDTISVQAGGKTVQVMIPSGSAPGTEIQFVIPTAALAGTPPAALAGPPPAAMAGPPPPALQHTYSSTGSTSHGLGADGPPPPPALYSKPPQATAKARPPAPGAPPPAPPPEAIKPSLSFKSSFQL